jgi:hypothetical protein
VIGLLALVAAGCGGGSGTKQQTVATKECLPPKRVAVPLSPGFPAPSATVYTGSNKRGSSTVVMGYVPGNLDAAVTGYEGAFSANNYAVTNETKHTLDATLDFNGTTVSGSVYLLQACRNITSVTIVVTPA